MFSPKLLYYTRALHPDRINDFSESIRILGEELDKLLLAFRDDASMALQNNQSEDASEFVECYKEINNIININKRDVKVLSTPMCNKSNEFLGKPYYLSYRSFKYTRPIAFQFYEEINETNTWKDLFEKTCEILDNCDNELFKKLPENARLNGVMSPYFSTKPYDIYTSYVKMEKSGVYVKTNHGSDTVCKIITGLLDFYGYNEDEYLIFLR